MTTVAITGVGGLLGRRVVDALDGIASVERIVGIDGRPPEGATSAKLRFHPMDLSDPDPGTVFEGVDTVLNLTLPADPARGGDAGGGSDVGAVTRLFEAARAAGVERIVHLSSVTVYGAHPDNDLALTEDSPLRGSPDPGESDRHRQVEAWLWAWADEAPRPEVAVLRTALTLGPGVDNGATRVLESPAIAVVRGHRPPLQFVHIDDLVAAVVHVVERELTGPYNVAATGWLSFDEVAAIVARPLIEVPEEVAFTATERLWRLGLAQPPAILRYLMYPCVVSSSRLVASGWQPRYVNRDALAASVAEHAPYVAVGRVRLRRSRLGAVVGALLAAVALLVADRVRRGRRRSSPAAPGSSPNGSG